MEKLTSYQRTSKIGRSEKNITIGKIDKFNEVLYKSLKSESEIINDATFDSFHQIVGNSNQNILTAYRSKQLPKVLLVVWRDFPYTQHAEQGSDLMLQEVLNGVEYLIVDSAFVQSGWMNDKIMQYLNEIWYPSLIELGLKGFVHIQSLSALGGSSFQKFKENTQLYLDGIGGQLKKKVFSYIPVEVGDVSTRPASLKKGLDMLLEMV
jgi:hypothetical protein